MRIIPVLDVQNGAVVRGVAGRRREYRPVVSCLTESSAPRDVVRAFREKLALSLVYLADLDAIEGAEPNYELYARLREEGCQLWVDAGLRDAAAAARFAGTGVEGVVVGLETWHEGPAGLGELSRRVDPCRLVFSLDLKTGQPLGDVSRWESPEPEAIAGEAIRQGVRTLIVLDLAQVGMGQGTGTDEVCARLCATYPGASIVAGGGIRRREDLDRFRALGLAGILVASALHDGQIGRNDLAGLDGC